MGDGMKKYIVVCKHCGSENVARDAWSAWDAEAQQWILHSTYDHATCFECEGETSLEYKEAEED
jgi:hypothetical protein